MQTKTTETETTKTTLIAMIRTHDRDGRRMRKSVYFFEYLTVYIYMNTVLSVSASSTRCTIAASPMAEHTFHEMPIYKDGKGV